MMPFPDASGRPPNARSARALTRRTVLSAGGLASLTAILAACGGSTPAPSAGTTSSGPATSSGSSGSSSAAASTGSSAAGADVTLDAATRSRLDAIFDSGVTETGVAGAAGFLSIGDQLWSRVAGVSDLATGEPFDPAAHVRIASISKTFTATAVLRLVDARELALDDVLETYVPGIANGTAITVFDLLGMRSGVFDYTSDAAFTADVDADPTLDWSDEQTLAIIKANPPAFPPGEKVVYADSNYALLGMILQHVTGKPAGEVITDQVISQLGLPDTSYPTGVTIPDPHPIGYLPDVSDASQPFDNATRPPRDVTEINPAFAGTAGAMISTPADLRTWARELTDGTLLTAQTQRARFDAIKRFDGQKLNFGYGLGIIGLNEFVGHDGAIFGFSSVALRRPQTDTTIVMVANESSNFTTPTMTVALGMIGALYPDQLR